jgi:hypothetical protein
VRVAWIRSLGGGIALDRPHTYMAFGIRGSGKSSMLEHIAEHFLANGSPVLDLFGSRDGEGLAWCRSRWAEDKKILLIHGDNSDVASSWDTRSISKYTLSDLDHYDIVISSCPLFSSPDQEYKDVNKIIDSIYSRRAWDKVTYIIVREAANLLYSRLKVSPDQLMAKASMAYFIREARHSGFALGIDTQRYTSIDIEIRATADAIFFKSLGVQGLPDDLKWMYSYINPFALQRMKPEEFVVLNSAGSVGVGVFPEVTWHKREGEDILKACGIEAEHGEEMVDSKPKFAVGDLEHARIVELRLAGESYSRIGGEKWTAQTVLNHVARHNKDVNRLGFCERCRRAKGENATVSIPRGRIVK